LIRHLDKAEAEAESVAVTLAGEHADWVLNGLLGGDKPGSETHQWYMSRPATSVSAILDLAGYVKRIRLARSHILQGNLSDALLLSLTVIAHPRVVVDRRDALLDLERRSKGGQSKGPAVAIPQTGFDLARNLIKRGDRLTANSLIDEFGKYTLTNRCEQWVEDEIYQVWRDENHIWEQRLDPPGGRRKVTFQTFNQAPHYYHTIRTRILE